MNKTEIERKTAERLAVDTEELQNVLCCGRPSAVEIGTAAGARVQIGRRVLWNVEKIQRYLNEIAE